MRVEVYQQSQKTLWDEFVSQSKNGTFLFLRDYMDYHSDRFKDYSLLIWDDKDNLIALLPANLIHDTVVSHSGLTFGGFITDGTMKLPKMLQVFEEALTYIKKHGQSKVIYKAIPHIYHRLPAEEDRYALFLCNARLVRSSALAVINNQHRLPFQERRNRGIRKAACHGLKVSLTNEFESYWKILSDRLLSTYNVMPVHSLSEMVLLKSRFPQNIKLFAGFKDLDMLAGVLVYETDHVAHVQYIAASDLGRELGALDLIFDELLANWYASKPFFDFGTSDEKSGQYLNKGLIDQKEGFGARAVAQDQYEIQLADWNPRQLIGVME